MSRYAGDVQSHIWWEYDGPFLRIAHLNLLWLVTTLWKKILNWSRNIICGPTEAPQSHHIFKALSIRYDGWCGLYFPMTLESEVMALVEWLFANCSETCSDASKEKMKVERLIDAKVSLILQGR